ncbi:hypothetical protein MNBD_GAMMA18-1759 [hydrothermal vent metagenome]|uniref:Cytochrome c domain-containing protein n=1 Tax=hydrothermal vent metagenome TaxID=652676 RepID=A0A3B0Z5X8_9ZZZZ
MAIFLKNKTPYILSCALLSSAMLLNTGCSNEGNEESSEKSGAASSLLDQATSAVDSAKGMVEDTAAVATSAIDSAKDVVENTAETAASAVDSVKDVAENTAEAATSAVDSVKDVAENTAEAATSAVAGVKTAVSEKIDKVVEIETKEVPSIDGAKVYSACVGCHGANGEGGVGPALNSQAPSDLVDKLTRYKAGEKLGPMTAMMTPIAQGLSKAETKAVTEYVVTLK